MRRRAEVDAASAERSGREACRALAAEGRLAGAPRYALHASTPDELPTEALAAWAVREGRTLLWPRVEGRDMAFVPCRPEALVPARFGIRTPPAGLPAVPLEPGDVVLVPGLAFDRRGGRLGRGGGHYDRALDAAPEGVIFVGLGYAFQCVDEVPMEARDRRMHALLSEEGLHWVAK